MEDPESVLSALGISVQDSSVPDDVWTRAVEHATDPNTPVADDSLVPEMTDEPVVPEGDELIYDTADLPDESDDHDGDLIDIGDALATTGHDDSVFPDSDGTDEAVHDVGTDLTGLDEPGFDDTTF